MKSDDTTVNFKFNIPDEARAAIQRGVERGDCVVEMEAMIPPLAQRTVNALEFSEYKIITLEDLLNCKPFHLMAIPNIGAKAFNQLIDCLSRYNELEEILENELTV